MKRIISRVALAALITTTVAPVAQAGFKDTYVCDFPGKTALFVGTLAAGLGMNYVYNKYNKAKLDARYKKQVELGELNGEINNLENEVKPKVEESESLVNVVKSKRDRDALTQVLTAVEEVNGKEFAAKKAEATKNAREAIEKRLKEKKAAQKDLYKSTRIPGEEWAVRRLSAPLILVGGYATLFIALNLIGAKSRDSLHFMHLGGYKSDRWR